MVSVARKIVVYFRICLIVELWNKKQLLVICEVLRSHPWKCTINKQNGG